MSRFIFASRRLNEFWSVRSQLAVGAALLAVSMVSGCTDVASNNQAQPTASSPARNSSLPPAVPIGPAIAQAAEPVPDTAAPEQPSTPPEQPAAPRLKQGEESSEPTQSGKILGQKTKDVRDAKKERAAGAKEVKPKITGNDPITVTGNAYTAMVGRTEQLKIKHQLDLWANLNGRYPKDYDEFKREIIDAAGIRLTQLPYYQKYGYDADKHELVILEYPH